jgi:hypothetical protein
MFKLHLTAALVLLSLAAGVTTASAAETGNKTMHLPPTHPLRSLPPTHPLRSLPPTHPLRSGQTYDYQSRKMYNYAAPHRYHHGCQFGEC